MVESRAAARSSSAREGRSELSDFGTRRRHGFLWHRWCVEAMQEGLGASFIGTSNVKHAMDTGLEAIGTNAHELPMVYAALAEDDEALREAPYEVLKDWAKMYGGNLLVVLPDCFGTTSFLDQCARLGGGLEGRAAGLEAADRRGAGADRLVEGARPRPAGKARRALRRDGRRFDRRGGARAARPGQRVDSAGAPT